MENVGFELEALAGTVDRAFQLSGAKARTREVNGAMVYEIYVPGTPRPLIISARVALPGEEVGAGKVGKKLKKVAQKTKTIAKKIAKSKALGKLAKVIGPIAAVVPGLQPLAAGVATAMAAKKIVQAAKKGHKGAKKMLGKSVSKLNSGLKANLKSPKKLAAAMKKSHGKKQSSQGRSGLYLVADSNGRESTVAL